MYRIFDIHTHIYPDEISEKAVINLGKFYNFVPEGKGTETDMCSDAKAFGVGGFLVFSVATNARQVPKVNDFIAALVKRERACGFKAIGFGGMHQDFQDMEGEIDRMIAMGLCGIKLHPDIQEVDIDDPRLMRLYEIAENRLPVYFHIGDDRPEYRFSESKKLAKVLDRFPKLEVVAAHLGGYKAWEEGVGNLAGRTNVWYDTSSALWATTPEYASSVIRRLGTDRVMFGTDYPVMRIDHEFERFLRLDLTEAERVDILWNNAARFLKLS